MKSHAFPFSQYAIAIAHSFQKHPQNFWNTEFLKLSNRRMLVFRFLISMHFNGTEMASSADKKLLTRTH